jgi:hypothetical protein
VLARAHRHPEAEPGQRARRRRDHDVQHPVVGLGVRRDLCAATDGPAVADADHQHRLPVVDHGSVHLDAHGPAPLAHPGHRAAHGVRRLAERVLQRCRLIGRLRPDAQVHDVDDHATGVVDDQVQRPGPAAQERGGCGLRLERDAERPGKVVSGAEREETDRVIGGELATSVHRRGQQVDRPIPTRQHELPTVAVVDERREIGRVGTLLDPHVGATAQHRHSRGDALLVGRPRGCVRDHHQSLQVASSLPSDPGRGVPGWRRRP